MDNHPKGWLHLYEPSLGMICSYGKVMNYKITLTAQQQSKKVVEFHIVVGCCTFKSKAASALVSFLALLFKVLTEPVLAMSKNG